jgi:hypothetical protein
MTKWIAIAAIALAVSSASATEPKQAKRPAPKTASGEIFCGPQGCRPVNPGCHIEMRVYQGMSGTMNMEVCK